MKNKIKERILCLMLGVGVAVAVGVTGCGKSDASSDSEETAKTEDMQEIADMKEESEPSENAKKQNTEEKDKTETVYVKSDAKGNPREITVQTKLKNTGDGDTIKDYTNLTDIKNKEGDEAFTQNADGTVEWENHGEDITYEGTGSAELPVDVSISYELDGQAIEPKELAGKSGQLKIRFDYKNKTTQTIKVDGKEEQVSVPFAVISMMLLSDDHASDIEVENGKVMDIDGQKLVIGYACPGLTKSLKLTTYEPTEDIDIPEYVEVTADVTDFSLDFTATIISSGLLEDMDLKDLDEVDEMSDNMKKLEEATDKLSDGAGALEEGMETYKTYLNQYLAGVAALDQGAGALESGLQVMNEKKGDLQAGATLLKESLTTLHNTLATVQLPQVSSLDLSGMEKMTVQDLIDIQKNIGNETAAMYAMEMTTSFAQEMAVKATGKPVEFFKLMPRGKIKKVQAAVIKGMDNSENADEVKKQLESHTLKFAAPYTYEGSEKAELKGKTFDSIELSGVGELNTMSESMAENRMAAGGFAPVNTHRNYLYCCIIASMGTGYPVDFFAGLPLCEAVKLRDAVNSDFFE